MSAVASDPCVDYEAVIGLEVHAELKTKTKMFCGCRNEFGAKPNTNVCPVCLGLPGALPVTNRKAIELAVRFGAAVDAKIGRAVFHRKNYFYPDMPKDFQITQYDEPINAGGKVEILDAGALHTIHLTRAHLEEDTGKSQHQGVSGRIHDATSTLIDYNRAGVPLLEIVSEPDIRTPDQAKQYVNELRAVLGFLDISDVKMEEGSMRVDANVSVRPVGAEAFGVKVEVKNMNSVRSLVRALTYEIERQTVVCREGGRIVQETRHWEEEDGRTHSMRSKEEAADYRYFPEPDLVPITLDQAWIEAISAEVSGVFPSRRAVQLAEQYGFDLDRVASVVYTPGLCDWVEAEIAIGANPLRSLNWASQEVMAHLNETGGEVAGLALSKGVFADLSSLIDDGTLSKKLAREVLTEVLVSGKLPRTVVSEKGLAQISDESELERIVAEVIGANPETIEKIRAGNKKVVGFLVGQVMKATKGAANPEAVHRLIDSRL